MAQDPQKFIPNLDGRQHSDWLFVEITRAQLDANGGIVEIEAPAGSTVVSGFVDVLVAGNGGTTDTLDIGDPTDDDRYTATAVDIKTTGRKTLTIGAGAFYYGKDGTTQKVRITAVQSGTASTTGKVVVALQFLQLGKWYFTQG